MGSSCGPKPNILTANLTWNSFVYLGNYCDKISQATTSSFLIPGTRFSLVVLLPTPTLCELLKSTLIGPRPQALSPIKSAVTILLSSAVYYMNTVSVCLYSTELKTACEV
jgi:hypothetical protein